MKKVLITLALIVVILATTFAFVGCSPKITIGVQAGTTGNKYVDGDPDLGYAGFKNAKSSPFDEPALAVKAMLDGNCDYVIIDNGPAAELVVANNGKIKMIDIALTTEEYAFGVDKNQANLLTAINNLIAEMKADGSLNALYAKYDESLGSDYMDSLATIESKAYNANKNQLVIATECGFKPYEYKVGNKFAGIDMEIAQKLATNLGMELVIHDMPFDSVVTSVGKNGVDIAMAGLTITETRKQSVTFSNAYYSGAYQVVLCKADDTTFDNCKTKEDVDKILAAK